MARRLRPEDWSWREVASWLDTEGTISSEPKRYRVRFTQEHRKVLEDLKTFLEKHGITGRIYFNPRTGVHYLEIAHIRQIQRLLGRVKRFFRLPAKVAQAETLLRAPLISRAGPRIGPKRPARIPGFDPKRKNRRWWDPW